MGPCVSLKGDAGLALAAYEGIIVEIRRMRAQEPIGTRENGLRRIWSSREDGSAACCEYRKRAGSKRADKGGSWVPVTATASVFMFMNGMEGNCGTHH